MKVWTVQGRDMPQNKKTDKADADIVQAEEGQKLHGQSWKTAKAKKGLHVQKKQPGSAHSHSWSFVTAPRGNCARS